MISYKQTNLNYLLVTRKQVKTSNCVVCQKPFWRRWHRSIENPTQFKRWLAIGTNIVPQLPQAICVRLCVQRIHFDCIFTCRNHKIRMVVVPSNRAQTFSYRHQNIGIQPYRQLRKTRKFQTLLAFECKCRHDFFVRLGRWKKKCIRTVSQQGFQDIRPDWQTLHPRVSCRCNVPRSNVIEPTKVVLKAHLFAASKFERAPLSRLKFRTSMDRWETMRLNKSFILDRVGDRPLRISRFHTASRESSNAGQNSSFCSSASRFAIWIPSFLFVRPKMHVNLWKAESTGIMFKQLTIMK